MMAGETFSEQGDALVAWARIVRDDLREDEPMQALRDLSVLAQGMADLAAEVAQQAYNGGATKKEISHALAVPASTLRGMRRTVERAS
jgi:hypothetical protein